MPVGISSSVMASSAIALDVLAQRPDGVPVRGHQHRAALLGGGAKIGHDGGLPVRDGPAHHVGQALGARDVARVEVPVPGVAGHVVGVARAERRGRRVVAAPPQHELGLPELLLDLGLVLALQVAVVAFVEAPVPADREPAAPGRRQGDLGRADGPGQDRGVQYPQVQRLLGGQQLAAGPGLGLAGRGQVHVDPAREQVVGVPGRLAVAEEDQVEHACDGTRGWERGPHSH